MKLLLAVTSCLLISSVLAKPKTTCEGDTAVMECKGKGKVIQITKAFWGREEVDVCKPEAVPGGGCSSDNVFSRMQTKCNGRKKCEVEASNGNFGDPCWGPTKYMISDYRCVPGGSVDICEDYNATIKCSGKNRLEIGSAFYGRETSDICDNVGVPWFGCNRGDAKQTASDLCNEKQQCLVEASNGVWGDPCWGVRKYATINYLCLKVSTTHICEWKTKTISCPEGQKLRIRKAKWGRFDSEVCRHAGIPAGGCENKKSTGMIKKACNNKNSCELTSSLDTYGDPCWGTPKYLDVQWFCR